mmetsp:Transcript_29862/g.55844  ORF Transcript_29862/g.55844 Transcript_29862/m.55844 type:complete len:87 (+) Transcript_29862:1039-1299(+)
MYPKHAWHWTAAGSTTRVVAGGRRFARFGRTAGSKSGGKYLLTTFRSLIEIIEACVSLLWFYGNELPPAGLSLPRVPVVLTSACGA